MMELLGACIVFFSSLFAVLERNSISSGQAGLSVSYALQVSLHELSLHIAIIHGRTMYRDYLYLFDMGYPIFIDSHGA